MFHLQFISLLTLLNRETNDGASPQEFVRINC